MTKRASLGLEVPAEPSFVATARMFAGSAARMLGVDEETIEDLKVAISEGCNGAIEVQKVKGAEPQPVKIGLSVLDDNLEIKITYPLGGDSSEEPWDPRTPTHLFQRTLGVGLIHALFPQAVWNESPTTGLEVIFTVPRTVSVDDEDLSL